jgi:hypothetical protein
VASSEHREATLADPIAAAAIAAQQLVAQGARAVVLAGSHVRGEATELSDLDLYAIGTGPAYTLRIVSGRLAAISWRTEHEEREALRRPATVGAVVPAWRACRTLHDPDGIAASLQREAIDFDWSTIASETDAWVAEAITGHVEEVVKLIAARRRDDRLLAAVQRGVLALRLPAVMAVHRRLLYETENRLWALVAEEMGSDWAAAQSAALGLATGMTPELAALRLFSLAATDISPLLTPGQTAVVELATSAIGEEEDVAGLG